MAPIVGMVRVRVSCSAGLLLSGRYARDDLRFLRTLDDLVERIPVLGADGLPVFGDDGLPVLEDVIILPDDPSAFIGRGTRALADLNARLDLGRGGPIATTLTGDHRSLRYSGGATDADSTRTSVGAESRLRLSPVTTGVPSLGFSRFASEDADRLQRDRLAIRFGLQHELSERLEISAGVGPGRVVCAAR